MAIDEQARMLASRAYKIANKTAGLKNNLTADRAPFPTDDKDAGYDIGSTWIYNSNTFTCIDSTNSKAVWSADLDLIHYDTWADLLTAISVVSPSYIGKYAIVANANGAPSSGITYKYGDSLSDFIVDGGSATFKINNQGATTYSVTTVPRTIVNPVITSIMTSPTVKPTVKGYYIFIVSPSDGLPSGVNLNDIAYFNGVTWSKYQNYTNAQSTIVIGTVSSTQLLYRKQQGSWRSASVLNGVVTVGDIDGSTWNCPVAGDIVSASKVNGGLSSNQRVTVNFPISISNATILYSIENTGTDYQTAKLGQLVWTKNSNTQITFWINETENVIQMIKLHIAAFLR